jgi:4-amino-4-deoxy-L-arabinose transferase-like glycosyltransferase
MAHTAAIVAALLAMRGAVEVVHASPRSRWSLTGGCALGMLVLIRPFEGVLIGLVCAGIVLAVRRSLSPTTAAATFGVVAIAVGSLTLPYNRALTGHALRDPISQYFDRVHYPGANRLGFGPDVGNVGWGNDALPGHSPLESLINASWNASLVQLELFGWAFGSLAVILLALATGPGWVDRKLVGTMAVVGVVVVGYTLYWYSAADFGPRYWSQMIVPLSALTAAALLWAPNATVLRRMAVMASLLGLPVVVVMRGTIKYEDYRGMTRDIEHLAEREGFGHDLVLIRGDVFSDFSPGLILNPPGFEGPGPLYFRWVGGEDLSVLRNRFPDRRVWVVDGASLAGGQPRVVSGPTP